MEENDRSDGSAHVIFHMKTTDHRDKVTARTQFRFSLCLCTTVVDILPADITYVVLSHDQLFSALSACSAVNPGFRGPAVNK
jgi:hypothetical protein